MDTSLEVEPLLALAATVTSEQRLDSVLQSIVRGLASQPGVASARIWLLDASDDLYLAASAGTPIDASEDWSSLQIAVSQLPILIEASAAQIRSFAVHPLIFRDRLLGAIAVFSRQSYGQREFTWLGLFAKQAAVAIANARSDEEELRVRDLSWQQIVDNIPGLVATTGALGEVEFLNRKTLEYFGKTGKELQDWALSGVVHPDDLPRVIAERNRSIATGQIYEIEHRCRRADGVYRWFQVRGLPVRNTENNVTAWYLLLTDIDDRKRAEDALRASELEARSSLDNLPGIFARAWPDGNPQTANQSFLDYFGKKLEDIGKWRLGDIVHSDDISRVGKVIEDGISSAQPFDYEHRIRRFDGVYRWFHSHWVPVCNIQGQILHWNILATDIDDRKLAEQALQERELNLRQITETIPEMLWSSTPEGSIDYCNGRLLEFTGFGPSEVQGTGWIKLIHPDDVERAVKDWLHCVKTGNPYRIEVRTYHAADHTYRWCITRALPLVDSAGRIVKWHGTVVDMHDWKVAQDELRSTQAELARMLRVTTLNVLTASIAHEINQPLASLVANASTSFRRLNDDPPNVDGARETVRRTIRDANRASEVVTRLRALFSNKEFTPETFDLNEVTREVIALSSTDLQGNRVILRLELAANLPFVTGDRVQLQQVSLNLLNNAADAMAGIEDRPRHLLIRTQQDGENQVRLSVQDAGCGINPDEFARLFEPFYTTKRGGMGIGLSISRSIIEKHRGRLWAEPNEGPGTTFSFSIPCRLDSSEQY